MRKPVKEHSRARIATKVVSWFARNARELPWRRTRDPYGIWVSEVMLQQTQVKTVIPYWERWMKRFPSVKALADAGEEQVLKAWEGLGYYSRARNLQKAARMICSEHGGEFPRGYNEVLALPGVGRYTAGAICSIAYNEATPILDGNVARVLTRVFAVCGSIKDRATQEKLWRVSSQLVNAAKDCSALNQGLMELGATVCLPREPRCLLCPLKHDCRARSMGATDEFPERRHGLVMRKRNFIALIIRHRNDVLVRKRESSAVNGGLWEFPNTELAVRENPAERARSYGVAVELVRTIKHTITRNRITVHAFAGNANGNAKVLACSFGARWRPITELESLPFSSAHAKLREMVQGTHGTGNKGALP